MKKRSTVRRPARRTARATRSSLRWKLVSSSALAALIIHTAAIGVWLTPAVTADADTGVLGELDAPLTLSETASAPLPATDDPLSVATPALIENDAPASFDPAIPDDPLPTPGMSVETDGAAASALVIPPPLIELTAADGQETTTTGATLTYTIAWQVRNGTAPDLVITDVLPPGETFRDASPGGVYADATRSVAWPLGVQNDGAAGTLSLTVTVDVGVGDGAHLFNNATAVADQAGRGTMDSVSAADDTLVVADPVVIPQAEVPAQPGIVLPPPQPTLTMPVLTLEKTVDKTAAVPNEQLTYRIVVKNTGSEPAENLALTDTLPAGLAFADVAGTARTWNLGSSFPAGGSTTLTYGVTVQPEAVVGSAVNTATLSAGNHATISDTATVLINQLAPIGEPQLTVVKTASSDRANNGDVIEYSVVVTNSGAAAAAGVTVDDVLPDGLFFADRDGLTRSWTIGTLDPQETETLTYLVVVADAAPVGEYLNFAEVSFDGGNPLTAEALIRVSRVEVLGAETGETLAETGPGFAPWVIVSLGTALATMGAVGLRRTRSTSNG